MDIDVKETPEYKMILALDRCIDTPEYKMILALDRCIDNNNEILKLLERLGKSDGTA